MIYIQTKNGRVTYIHYMPFDEEFGLNKTEDELLQDGYLVDSIPQYEGTLPDGARTELYYNGTEFSFGIVEGKRTKEDANEEKILSLETQLEATNEALLGLMNMVTGV